MGITSSVVSRLKRSGLLLPGVVAVSGIFLTAVLGAFQSAQLLMVLVAAGTIAYLWFALRQSETRHRTTLQAIPDLMFRNRADGTILDIHAPIPDLLLVPKSESIGRNLQDILPPDIAQLLMHGIEETVRTQRIVRFEYSAVHQGVLRDFEERMVPAGADEVLGIVREITEQKKAEALNAAHLQDMKSLQEIFISLSQIEDLDMLYLNMVTLPKTQLGIDRIALFLVVEATGDLVGTYGVDPSGQIVNEKYYREHIDADHWTMEVFDSPNHTRLWENAPLYHDGVEIATGWRAAAALWDGQRAVGYLVSDNFVRRQPPRPYQAELISLLGSAFGHLIRLKHAQESLRRSEARHRATLSAIPDLILRNRVDGTYVDVHAPRPEILLAPIEEMLTSTIPDLLPPELAGMLMSQLEQVTQTQQPSQFEYTLKIGGRDLTFEERLVPVGDDEALGIVRDITDIRETQRALAESVELYRLLAENITEAIALHYPDGRIAYMSPSIREISGYCPDELLAMPPHALINLVHPEDRLTVRDSLQRVNSGETVNAVECRLMSKAGNYVWVETYVKPILDEKGQISRFLGATGIIDERKTAELALRESEARASALLKALPDTFFRISDQGMMLDFHSSAEDLYMSPDSIIGTRLTDALPADVADEAMRNIRRALETRDLRTFEYALSMPDVGVQYYEARLMPSLANEVTAVIRNITERKRAEQRLFRSNQNLNTLYEVLLELLSRRAMSEILQTVVRSAENILESPFSGIMLLDGDSLVVRAISDGMSFINGQRFGRDEAQLSWQVFDAGEPITLPDYLQWSKRRSDYDALQIHAVANLPIMAGNQRLGVMMLGRTEAGKPFTDEDLQLARMLSQSVALVLNNSALYNEALREIRERVAAEEALKQANVALREFAYIISHDMKAPLRGIVSIAGWLETDYEQAFDENGRNYLRLLKARVRRMEKMIDGVLEYSRIGRVSPQNQPVDLNRIVTEVVELIALPAHIEVKVPLALPTVTCDPTRIAQVFQNLIDNAVKYMDKPQGEITITFRSTEAAWEFSVTDNGPGIEERYFEKIFQIFQTLTPRDTFESTGVGLTIVKRIVESFGGQIWLSSQVGHGSTFTFTLPK